MYGGRVAGAAPEPHRCDIATSDEVFARKKHPPDERPWRRDSEATALAAVVTASQRVEAAIPPAHDN
jgi:hypothetical protein